jgi:hypothetical protein
MSFRVECYAGYRGEETPRRIYFGERKVEIIEVLDRWQGPDHRYFKVLGEDRSLYIVRYDGATGRWELTMFDSSAEPRPGGSGRG